MEVPRKNPIREWVESPQNSWEYWVDRADRAKDDAARLNAMRHAYVTDEGFYHFCDDIAGFKDMHIPFHGRMAPWVVAEPRALRNAGHDRYWDAKQSYMLQAFRSSFKSSMSSVAYPCWLIAREYVLMLDGKLPGVNIQIGLASESLDLPADHLQACCRLMDSEEFVLYFGQHGPKDRGKGAKWGRTGATTLFRSNKALRDPTIWTISLEATRTGRHFDIIICDDLQAERSSASKNQLRETWRLYKLLFPLLNPPATSYYSLLFLACTRWNEQDIYGKMEQENDHKAKRDRTAILRLPVCNEAEIATCPTIYKTEDIPSLKSRGIDEFNTQYLLRPRSSKTSAFQREWIQYYDPASDNYRNDPGHQKSYVVLGVDFCWVEAARRNDDGADHSVVFAWRVLSGNRWYLVRYWREQESRYEALNQAKLLYDELGAEAIGFSVSDKKHIEGDIHRFEFERRFTFNKVWVSDLAAYATGDDTHKNRKIIGTLQRLFKDKKVYIPMGLTWFEEEILACPMGITDDGLDAFVCAVEASRPPVPEIPRLDSPWASIEDMWARHTQALLEGKPIYLNGQRIRGAGGGHKRAAHRSARRARSWRSRN